MTKKRETTRWRFRLDGKGGTYIRVGRVYNGTDVPEDIIRYQVRSASPGGSSDFCATVDEALAIAAGLNLLVMEELAKDSKHVRERYR